MFYRRIICVFWSKYLTRNVKLKKLFLFTDIYKYHLYYSQIIFYHSHLVNLIELIDCWKTNDKFSWNNFYFIAGKEY